jgi:hypothetical protein
MLASAGHPVCGQDGAEVSVGAECSTPTREKHQCTTVVEKCNTISEKQCTTITEQECDKHVNCWDEPRQKCWDEPRTVCSEVPHEKCWDEPRQVCKDVPRQFLDFEMQEQVRVLHSADLPPPGHQGGVCHRSTAPVQDGDAAKVPHREVPVTTQVPQEQCYDRAEVVCVPVSRTECTTVQEERRKEVPRKEWKEVAREECKEVPREECKEVPREECQQVPRCYIVTSQLDACSLLIYFKQVVFL